MDKAQLERVYRADITGIRHPDAEFIAHAREDVRVLLAGHEAALALADSWEAKSREIWAQIEIQDCDQASAGFKAIGATSLASAAKELRAALAAALESTK